MHCLSLSLSTVVRYAFYYHLLLIESILHTCKFCVLYCSPKYLMNEIGASTIIFCHDADNYIEGNNYNLVDCIISSSSSWWSFLLCWFPKLNFHDLNQVRSYSVWLNSFGCMVEDKKFLRIIDMIHTVLVIR